MTSSAPLSNMASGRLLPERYVQEEPLCAHRYSLLIITGPISHRDQAGHIRREIERGVRSWDVNLSLCPLGLYLQEFLTHHIVSLRGPGPRCLRHSTSVLDTQVLLSPAQDQVLSEVCSLLARDSSHKLLVLAGQSVAESGDLLLHGGRVSPQQLKSILTQQLTDRDTPACSGGRSPAYSLTLSCPNVGLWRDTFSGGHPALLVNPPEVLLAMEALGEFTSLVAGSLHPWSPFEVLPPPGTVGFLKLSRPCCYVFPAGRGNCAFFAVNGFTMLVDGGADPQACFWKLVRHLDRVDALLLSHISTSSLAGVNTFLERKVAEMELGGPDGKDDLTKRLISPELGVVFFNAPCSLQMDEQPCVDGVLKSADQAAVTIKLLKKLDIVPQPMFRPKGAPIQPMTLFQKMGVGQLEMYILHPGKTSQEYQALMQSWPDQTNPSSQIPAVPITSLASVCALLVWHPACPQEKVVRVLFPGATPQAKLLEGLERLRGLAFLQKPTVTTEDLEGQKEPAQAKRKPSQDSGKEAAPRVGKEEVKEGPGKEKVKVMNGDATREEGKKGLDKSKVKNGNVKPKLAPTDKNVLRKGGGRDVKKDEKVGKREDSGPKKREQAKKEVLLSKPKNDNKTKPQKEVKKDPKTGGKKPNKPSGKEIKTGSNLVAKKASVNTELQKTESGTANAGLVSQDVKTESPGDNSPRRDNSLDQNHPGPQMSPPEDITEDVLRLRGESAIISEVGPRSEILAVQSGDSEGKTAVFLPDRADVTSLAGADRAEDTPEKPTKAVRVVGFPGPLNLCSQSDQTDLTPTEYTLLDGALKNSPPSRSSADHQGPASPDEETVGHTSSGSRPNSAGHTPYGLSPDDVWCKRDKLSQLRAQMGGSDPTAATGEGPQGEAKGAQECHATFQPREKHLTSLSLGTFKESGAPDPSPSVTTTTTTTHSMPAEAISPQSTEVDESLSMSFEQGSMAVSQREGDDSIHHSLSNGSHCVDTDFRVGMSLQLKKAPRSLGQGVEMGRPPAPSSLHFETEAHDVDLCLVSPCEFKHFKPAEPGGGSGGGERHEGAAPVGPQHHGNNNNNGQRDASFSESNAPHCTEDCPSTTADGGLDSDSDESCSEPTSSLHEHHAPRNLPPDPPPAPLRDGPPPAPRPDPCMPVPLSDPEVHGRAAKTAGTRGKKFAAVLEASHRTGPTSGTTPTGGRSRGGGGLGGGLGKASPRSSGTKTSPAKPSASPEPAKPGGEAELSVQVDLAYIPSGSSSATVDVDFFRRVRSACYIISGDGPEREELMKQTLDALLEGKATWSQPTQVTVIPTFESAAMQAWYQQTLERQKQLDVVVLGSNSTVAMQDETFPACKIEF